MARPSDGRNLTHWRGRISRRAGEEKARKGRQKDSRTAQLLQAKFGWWEEAPAATFQLVPDFTEPRRGNRVSNRRIRAVFVIPGIFPAVFLSRSPVCERITRSTATRWNGVVVRDGEARQGRSNQAFGTV